MKTLALFIGLLIACICLSVAIAQAGSVTYGTTIDIEGGLKLVNGNLCFPDSSCMSTAYINDGSAIWGEITGLIANQTDLQNSLNLKADKTTLHTKRVFVTGTTPTWQSQGNNWVHLPEFDLLFTKNSDTSTLHITYTDNIGLYSNQWCNVGIFIDNLPVPICSGSWSGSPYSTLFQQAAITCDENTVYHVIQPDVPYILPAGSYTLKIKHRSQGCAYGNYAFDESGSYRSLTVKEY